MESLKECITLLDVVQKGLSDYLETKRMLFPRFFFLSDDELLEILAQTKNVRAVQPHLRKCFENMKVALELIFLCIFTLCIQWAPLGMMSKIAVTLQNDLTISCKTEIFENISLFQVQSRLFKNLKKFYGMYIEMLHS